MPKSGTPPSHSSKVLLNLRLRLGSTLLTALLLGSLTAMREFLPFNIDIQLLSIMLAAGLHLSALLGCQLYLTRQTNGVFNPPLLLATAISIAIILHTINFGEATISVGGLELDTRQLILTHVCASMLLVWLGLRNWIRWLTT